MSTYNYGLSLELEIIHFLLLDTLRTSPGEWRPRGVLISHLHEHASSVNCLAVSQDDSFFASASDDGTVKIWDVRAIDREIRTGACSRVTYAEQVRVFFVDVQSLVNSLHIQ